MKFYLILFAIAPIYMFSQQGSGLYININCENLTLPEIFREIEIAAGIKIYYDPYELPYSRRSLKLSNQLAFEVLARALSGTSLSFTNIDQKTFLIGPASMLKDSLFRQKIVSYWEQKKPLEDSVSRYTEIFKSIGDESGSSGDTFRITGLITDYDTREGLSNMPVKGQDQLLANTDFQGVFSILLPAGENVLLVEAPGYRPQRVHLRLFADGRIDLQLEGKSVTLEEVVIRAVRENFNVQSVQTGQVILNMDVVNKLPTLLGERDIVRSLQNIAGVNTVGEGSTGFNVRGGQIDQNLIIMDEAPIWNSSHALGFFSIFNTDLVSSVSLYKGNIPAQFGGRSSSVLEVNLKQGNFTKYSLAGGIGLVSSRLLFEGPLWKNRTSVILGGRASYTDWVLRNANIEDAKGSSANFNDFNGKITHRFTSNSILSLSAFHSKDFFRFGGRFGFEWRTQSVQADWRHIFNERLSSKLHLIRGRYSALQFEPEGSNAFSLENGLRYQKAKYNLLIIPGKSHTIHTGLEWNYLEIDDEKLSPRGGNSQIIPNRITNKDQGHEGAIYLNSEFSLSKILDFSLGIRYSSFWNVGPRTVYLYETGRPKSAQSILDSIVYRRGDVVQRYGGIEPRIALKVNLSPTQAIKMSYNKLRQYSQLISTTSAATPVDNWQAANTYIRPQISDNVSLGYFQNFKSNIWETSLEVYYRNLQNSIAYKDFPDLFLNAHLETELLTGKGRAYGIETTVKKNYGKWSGALTYTFARSEQRVKGSTRVETINGGKWFPQNYDQPHQINYNTKWQFHPRNALIVNYAYRSGRPITIPISNYPNDGVLIPNISDRNRYRIPEYSRVDVSYIIDYSKGKNGLRWDLNLSIYNLFSRKNPYSVFFEQDPDLLIPKAFQLSILGAAFPAFSWNFTL